MKTLTATHEGQTFKRKTDRNYTHVVIAKYEDGRIEKSWASSLILAQKAMNQFSNAKEIKIIEVEKN